MMERVVRAYDARDNVALTDAVASAGVAHVVRWLRASSCPAGPMIVATLVRQQQERSWHRELVQAGAVGLLTAALQKRPMDHGDSAAFLEALCPLSPVLGTKVRAVVRAAVAASANGDQAVRRAALALLHELSMTPENKPVMLKTGVVALCVDVLGHTNAHDAWQLAVAILAHLNKGASLVSETREIEEEETDGELQANEEEVIRGERVIFCSLSHDIAPAWIVTANGDLATTFAEIVSKFPHDVRLKKLKTLHALIARRKCPKPSVAPIIPTLKELMVEGTEDEQLVAAKIILTVIDGCKPNALAALQAGGINAFLGLFNTHADVTSAASALQLFVRRLHAIHTEETCDGVVLVLTSLLDAAQDASNDQGAVAIELLCLLSTTTRSFLPSLVDAGIVRVFSAALDALASGTYSGAIQLRHVAAMVSMMATETAHCEELLEEAVVDKLITLLKRAPPGTRTDLAETLSRLANNRDVKPLVGSSGCLEIFVGMLSTGNESEQAAAADALIAACTDYEPNVVRLRCSNVADVCFGQLESKAETLYDRALQLLTLLTADLSFRPNVKTVKVALQALSKKNGSSNIKVHAANLIETLARHSCTQFTLARHGVRDLLLGMTHDDDQRVRTAAAAARRSLVEQSFELQHALATHTLGIFVCGNGWVTHTSRASGELFFCNLFTKETQWERPAVNKVRSDLLITPEVGGHPELLAQLHSADGVRVILNVLEADDAGSETSGRVVTLLHHLALDSDSTKQAMETHFEAFSRRSQCSNSAECDAAARAIVNIFPPMEWIKDEPTRAAVVDSFVRIFCTEDSAAKSVTHATKLVTSLRDTDSIDAKSALAAFYRGLFTYASSTASARATLALQLILEWADTPELGPRLVEAGAPALCVAVIQERLKDHGSSQLGAVTFAYVHQLALAIAATGVGDKLIEAGAVEALVSFFEKDHPVPTTAAHKDIKRVNEQLLNLRLRLFRTTTSAAFSTHGEEDELLSRLGTADEAWFNLELLCQLARRHPQVRSVIGASTSLSSLAAVVSDSDTPNVGTTKAQYINLLAALCLECPENIQRVDYMELVDACVKIVRHELGTFRWDLLLVSSAVCLIYSFVMDAAAGPLIASHKRFVDAVIYAARAESHENHRKTQWMATKTVGVLVRYAPSRAMLVEAGVEAMLESKIRDEIECGESKKTLEALRKAMGSEDDDFYMISGDDLAGERTDEDAL